MINSFSTASGVYIKKPAQRSAAPAIPNPQFYINIKSASTVPTLDNTSAYTLTNSSVTISTDATRGKVLFFNNSQYINTNYPLPIIHTRSFWVNLTSTSSANNTLSSNNRPFWFSSTNYLNFSLNYSGGGTTVADSGNTIVTGTWYYYTLTYDGTTAKLYRNGNLDISSTATVGTTADTIQIGAYSSANFLYGYMDNIRCYNTALTQPQIQAIYSYELANPTLFYIGTGVIATPSNTSIITNLISGVTPYAIYDASDWNSTTKVLPEARGLTAKNMITTVGTITSGKASGNGAAASVSYISGTTTSKLTWPASSVPANFTICSITRYAGSTNQRILTGTSGNWLHGHWGGLRGVAYYEGWKTQVASSVGTLANWLVMCGNNGSSNGSNILVDSVQKGTASGGTGGYALTINAGSFSEVSDWGLAYLIIYDRVLTDAQMKTVSDKLLLYLSTGNM